MENENNKLNEEVVVKKSDKKTNKKRQKRKLAWLFALTGVTAIVLIVETYAWFIGTGSIYTSEFEIGVSTEKSLFLSLDGENWSENLTISRENILGLLEEGASISKDNHNAYEGNTNKWVDETVGLIPISTSGEKDNTVSRLKLFGKSSITATPGGFRLISTRLDNYSEAVGEDGEPTGLIVDEREGYVAFDLFIKNGEGVDYIEKYNEEDDEAIYLTTNSTVSVVKAGETEVEDYGLANSVRVAFAQIGRVASATASTEDIIGMVCSPENTGDEDENGKKTPVVGEQTGLCDETKTTIWEPNDTSHNAMLIDYFERVCKGKEVTTGEEGKMVVTYGVNEEVKCVELADGTATETYVVKDNITSTDNVDVYDGINGYEIDELETYKIAKYDTFTDTEKEYKDELRPHFFKLAANSVTKIRVYIYLEGQDVDNYDLISLGKKIKINFGFTKDQFDLNETGKAENEEEDV